MTPTSEDLAAWKRLGEQRKRNAEQARELAEKMGPWLRELERWRRDPAWRNSWAMTRRPML